MLTGIAIGIASLFLLALMFALCAAAGRADEQAEIIERRIRAIAPLEPDHAGTVVPFGRRSA
jgi:hypothetical protein